MREKRDCRAQVIAAEAKGWWAGESSCSLSCSSSCETVGEAGWHRLTPCPPSSPFAVLCTELWCAPRWAGVLHAALCLHRAWRMEFNALEDVSPEAIACSCWGCSASPGESHPSCTHSCFCCLAMEELSCCHIHLQSVFSASLLPDIFYFFSTLTPICHPHLDTGFTPFPAHANTGLPQAVSLPQPLYPPPPLCWV